MGAPRQFRDRNQPARLRPPRWRDPRVLAGLAIVALCVLGTWQIVRVAADTTKVWAARSTIVPGSIIAAADLVAVEVKLPQSGELYFTADKRLATGSHAIETVGEGELLPRRAIGGKEGLEGHATTIAIRGVLPTGVGAGSRIDVWEVPQGDGTVEAEPVELLTEAVVLSLDARSETLGMDNATWIEVLVSNNQMAGLVSAQAADHFLVVATNPSRAPDIATED